MDPPHNNQGDEGEVAGVVMEAAVSLEEQFRAALSNLNEEELDNASAPEEEEEEDEVEEQWRAAMNELNEEELLDDNDDGVIIEEEQPELPVLMGYDDPRRMILTREEADWARHLKEIVVLTTAAAGEDTCDNDKNPDDFLVLNDFQLGQLALICRHDDDTNNGGVEGAIHRAKGLQAYREMYGIRDSYAEGCQALQVYMTELIPGLYLDFFFCNNKGTYVMAENGAKFLTRHLTSRTQKDQVLVGVYYFLQACCPDFESIRKGTICLTDCGGMSLTTRQDYRLLLQMFEELVSVYPLTGSLLYYNAGVLCNVMLSAMKSFLPTDLKKRFKTGLQFDGGLEGHFMIPNAEIATQRVVTRMQANLKRRYENENNFCLPSSPSLSSQQQQQDDGSLRG